MTELVGSKTNVKRSIVNFQELTQSVERKNSVGQESCPISERLVYHYIVSPDSRRKSSSAKLGKKNSWCICVCVCMCMQHVHICARQICNQYVPGGFL